MRHRGWQEKEEWMACSLETCESASAPGHWERSSCAVGLPPLPSAASRGAGPHPMSSWGCGRRLAAAAKSLQSFPTLCDPTDGSPPGSPVPGILQARTLGWVAISFSSAWKWKVKVKSHSRVRLVATPWTAAYQAPTSMGFSRQEYWSGVPLPSPPLLCLQASAAVQLPNKWLFSLAKYLITELS